MKVVVKNLKKGMIHEEYGKILKLKEYDFVIQIVFEVITGIYPKQFILGGFICQQ